MNIVTLSLDDVLFAEDVPHKADQALKTAIASVDPTTLDAYIKSFRAKHHDQAPFSDGSYGLCAITINGLEVLENSLLPYYQYVQDWEDKWNGTMDDACIFVLVDGDGEDAKRIVERSGIELRLTSIGHYTTPKAPVVEPSVVHRFEVGRIEVARVEPVPKVGEALRVSEMGKYGQVCPIEEWPHAIVLKNDGTEYYDHGLLLLVDGKIEQAPLILPVSDDYRGYLAWKTETAWQEAREAKKVA